MPDPRLALFYALNFCALGVTLPYLAPWLASRGVDPATTGTIAAAPSFAVLGAAFALGALADRLADRRTAIVALSWVSCAAYACLFAADGPWGIGLVWTVAGTLLLATMPILDGAALARSRARGTPWGPVRAFGSAGFIVGLTAGGLLFERAGPGAFVPAVAAVALARALAATALPRFARPAPEAASAGAPPAGAPAAPVAASPGAAGSTAASPPGGAILRHPGFLAVLLGAALINGSHAFLYTFGLLHWTRAGISESLASALWTASIAAEVVLLWRFAAIARRVSARGCLLLAAAAAALRWLATATDPHWLALLGLQTLHAASFGLTCVATASFIARRAGEAFAARAQALAATLSTATMATLTLLSGALYEGLGADGYRVMAAVCALGAALVALSYRTDLEDRPEPA